MKGHSAKNYSLMPVLALFFVFCLCAVSVAASGAMIYKSTVSQMNKNSTLYTSTQYIQEKYRQNNSSYSVIHDDTDIIVFSDDDICTYIYCYDGWLRELVAFSDTQPVLSRGQKLTDITSLSADETDGILTVTVTDTEDNSVKICLTQRAGG